MFCHLFRFRVKSVQDILLTIRMLYGNDNVYPTSMTSRDDVITQILALKLSDFHPKNRKTRLKFVANITQNTRKSNWSRL